MAVYRTEYAAPMGLGAGAGGGAFQSFGSGFYAAGAGSAPPHAVNHPAPSRLHQIPSFSISGPPGGAAAGFSQAATAVVPARAPPAQAVSGSPYSNQFFPHAQSFSMPGLGAASQAFASSTYTGFAASPYSGPGHSNVTTPTNSQPYSVRRATPSFQNLSLPGTFGTAAHSTAPSYMDVQQQTATGYNPPLKNQSFAASSMAGWAPVVARLPAPAQKSQSFVAGSIPEQSPADKRSGMMNDSPSPAGRNLQSNYGIPPVPEPPMMPTHKTERFGTTYGYPFGH